MSSRKHVAPNTAVDVTTLDEHNAAIVIGVLEAYRCDLVKTHDCVRLSMYYGAQLAFILDFDLLYRYAFVDESSSDWCLALDYLLSCDGTAFLIGPGTRSELDHLLRSTRRVALDVASPREIAGNTSAFSRLTSLLTQPTVYLGDDPESVGLAYEQFERWLVTVRATARAESNKADAQNLAFVSFQRDKLARTEQPWLPLLLTGTRQLLDERAMPRGLPDYWPTDLTISPRTAIYNAVHRVLFPDPVAAMQHVLQQSIDTANMVQALWHLVGPEDVPGSERAYHRSLDYHVSPALSMAVDELSAWMPDPVLYEARRVYDQRWLGASGSTPPHAPADDGRGLRRLFDVMSELSAVVDGITHHSDRRLP